MENFFDSMSVKLEICFFMLITILIIVAIVRIAAKLVQKKRIEITPVGINEDLPSSVTGMNKHKQDE